MAPKCDPFEICEAVHDEASFLQFLNCLMINFQDSQKQESQTPSSPYSPAANGWENITIDRFLEAAIAWAAALPSETENPWKRASQIIYMGKVYE